MKTIKQLEKELNILRKNKGNLGENARFSIYRYLEGQFQAIKDVLKEINWHIREIESKVVNMKKKYEDRPSATRERTYLQYRKALKYFYKLKQELVGK